MSTFLIYRNFYDPERQQLMLGGIENYLLNLARLLSDQGEQCTIVQTAKADFCHQFENFQVIGVNCKGFHGNRKKIALFNKVKELAKPQQDTVIFGTDSYFVANDFHKSIAIQHGVSWDKPAKGNGFWHGLKRFISHIKYLKYLEGCKNLVCVDHNFVNWYRTYQSFAPDMQVDVILNYSPKAISSKELEQKWLQPLAQPRLLIARRFVDYRGIPLAIEVVQALLEKYPQLQVSFAGEGPLAQAIETAFAGNSNVDIFRYTADESVDIHQRYDLVLLPSIGSEGSSLSLAEALAAGCAVVTTNVGGLSNMVIDHYNGLITMPDKNALVEKLSYLLDNPETAKTIAHKGHQVATESLSLHRWQQQWLALLNRR